MSKPPANDHVRIDIGDDDLLRTALRGEVPPPGDSYWALIDEQLAAALVLDADPGTEAREHAPDVSVGGQNESGTMGNGLMERLRTWPVLAAAAALVLVAGLLTIRLIPSNGERVDAGFAEGNDLVALEDLPGPTQNTDHWHAIYGIWDCTAEAGNGAWLPVFDSNEDDVGIHSHGDGLISIHPFFEESAGVNATFSHFADSMNFTITNDTITLEDGTVLSEGAMCNGQPAVIEMYRWQDARALEEDPTQPPRIIVTEDFGAQRFYNDFEVWTVALTPAGAEVPLPPQARFDALAPWWWQRKQTLETIAPTPIPGRTGISFPEHDSRVSVGLVAIGPDADPVIEELLASRAPGLFGPDQFEGGSGLHLLATASGVRLEVELLSYSSRDEMLDPPAPAACWEVIAWGGGCSVSHDELVRPPRLEPNTGGDIETLTLLDAPVGARWLSVQVENGQRVIADVVEGASWLAWRADQGDWVTAEILDIDQNVLWSKTR